MSINSVSLPPKPAAGTFKIETTHYDGRAYAMLMCAPCAWYAYYVRERGIRQLVGDHFRTADFGSLMIAAQEHECPQVVRDAK